MIFNNKYEPKNIIGQGNSIIFKVLDKDNNKFYALKLFKIYNDNEIKQIKDGYEKEIEILKNIKNKYIIKLKDNFYDEILKSYCIVMELCDGNLRNILEKYKPNGLPFYLINKIFIQLNEALKIIIDNGYIHSDLKPENILIIYIDKNKNNFDIKLTDFGLPINEINSSIGINKYMAPEIENKHYNKKFDLWSLGVILYELYTNKYIFYSDNKKVENENRYEGKIVNETDNEMINKLIRKLIQVDINKRIQWEEYFADQFFNKNIEKKIIKKIKFIDLKSHALKIIFSFLNEDKKLNLIKNNKNLQKILDVDIQNYKKFKKIYKIVEKNGKGKEYLKNNNQMVFEGEYINGDRNGKGKEYNYIGKLIFEGEYLNGKRWNGKGKEFSNDSKLKYEIEYLNGERNRKIKEYNYNDKLIFEGEYLNGEGN